MTETMHGNTPGSGSTQRQQVFLAAMMWSIVGLFLFARGIVNIFLLDDSLKYLWMALALVVGLVKAKIVLAKTADRIVARIFKRPPDASLWGFLSVRSWVLIVLMIAMGKLLRASPLPRSLVWSVYIAIGAALFSSSKIIWDKWRCYRQVD